MFSKEELKAWKKAPAVSSRFSRFVPDNAVDPIFYDKAYFIAPDKRGGKPYSLLQEAMLKSHRCACERNTKGKTHMVQIRPTEDGLVFQQLLWGNAVRSQKDLNIEHVPVSDAELQLALKIVEQGEADSYDPSQYENEEQKRVLAAIDAKIAGKQIVTPAEETKEAGGQVIDLMEALRTSLAKNGKARAPTPRAKSTAAVAEMTPKPRKTVKRAEKVAEPVAETTKVRGRR